ncbi:MAG: hypothetical protein AB8B69_25825 [Chitinophagales bacterium]
MAQQQLLTKKGIVLKVLDNAMYLVKDISSEDEVTVVISGKTKAIEFKTIKLQASIYVKFEIK